MTLSYRDAAELEKALGIGQWDKSTLGPQLDRLMMYSSQYHTNRRGGEPTVRITAEARETPKAEPDMYLLEVFGRVSRRLKRVSEQDATCCVALTWLYGDDGSVAAKGKYGRVSAIFALTDAGRKLDEKETKRLRGPKLDVNLARRIASILIAQEMQPLIHREPMIQRALAEAYALKDRAESLYTATGAERGQR
jgi:hypothetical protein